MTFKVEGQVVEGYENVKKLFQKGVEKGTEYNAQLCVYVEGEINMYLNFVISNDQYLNQEKK